MNNDQQGSQPPEEINAETEKVKEELRQAGNSFEGDTPEEKEELTPAPVVVPEEKKEEEKKEEKKEEEPKPEPEPVERKPREIPAWQVEIAKKRQEKEEQEKETKLQKEIDNLKSENEELKGAKIPEVVGDSDKLIEDLSDKLEAGDITLKDYNKEFASIISQGIKPDEELKEKIQQLGEAERQRSEDVKYINDFQGKITPLIKEEYPNATIEDIEAINKRLKNFYFEGKYVSLDIDEVYRLKKAEFEKEISPDTLKSVESGNRKAGRQGKVTDYAEITESEFAKLSPEEQDKVLEFKTSSTRA